MPWRDLGVDIVLECSGKFTKAEKLQPYFDNGVAKVIVAAPVKDGAALNIVMGVNDHLYDPARHHLLTASALVLVAGVITIVLAGENRRALASQSPA